MKIMIDAGHGPNTPGKRSPDHFKEFQFNSKVADFAKHLLVENKDVTVYFAHNKKEDVPLEERTDKANKSKVDCYVSIHANAYGTTWNSANGIETYVYTSKPKEALELAEKVQKNLVIRTGLNDRGVKTADFHVLRETNMTAILCECGFYTNKREEALMQTESYQKSCAEAIVKALVDQYHLKKAIPATKKTSTSTKTSTTKKFYHVQVGSNLTKDAADKLVKELKSKGYNATLVSE